MHFQIASIKNLLSGITAAASNGNLTTVTANVKAADGFADDLLKIVEGLNIPAVNKVTPKIETVLHDVTNSLAQLMTAIGTLHAAIHAAPAAIPAVAPTAPAVLPVVVELPEPDLTSPMAS